MPSSANRTIQMTAQPPVIPGIPSMQGKENSVPEVQGSAEYTYYLEQVKMLNAMKQNL